MRIEVDSRERPRRNRVYVRKTDVVLAAAEEAFIKGGYSGVSIDAIAERAGVSKRTVYSNFANKETLFAAVIKNRCKEVVPAAIDATQMAADCEVVLIELAIRFLQALYSPDMIALYQTVVAECRHQPEIGRIMYEGPITRSHEIFDSYLRQQVAMGRMQFPAIDLAAAQLIALLKTNIHMQLIFSRPVKLTHQAIRKIASASVRLFLYGCATPGIGNSGQKVNHQRKKKLGEA